MPTGATGQLGLALPVQGELSGTWGNTVNNGITEYTNIAIAGTTTFNGDGAVTLVNTTGDASATNIASTSAQYAIVRVTGTLTTAKIITFGSAGSAPYSKLYLVDNAATGDIVTFKAYGQTGVSVAVGEKCFVYYNGTDIVKAASSTADGVTTISFGSTGLTPATATSGAVTVSGTLAIANGGTGTSSTTFANLTTNVTGTLPTANGGTNLGGATPFTANGVVYASSTSALATGSALTYNGNILLNQPTTGTGFSLLQCINTGGTAYIGLDNSTGGILSAYALNIYHSGAYPIVFSTSGTERARIDSAGYLSGVCADKVTALGNSGTATTITCTAGNVYTATLTGNCTFTLAAPSTTTANTATSFTLILTNDATAGRTVAWAGGSFLFPGGSVTRTTTANAVDIWFFFSPNGGTTWYGSIPMANLS